MNDVLRRYGFTCFAPDDGGSGGGSGDGGEGGSGSGDAPKTFTQADLDRLTGQARQEARRRAEQELASSLGMTPEEAKKKLEELDAAETARLGDIEKREKAAADAKTKAEADSARARATQLRAEAIVALAAEGVQFERDNDGNLTGKGARLLSMATSNLSDDADGAAIAAEVASLKADLPEMFTASASSEGGEGEGGEGSGDGGDGAGDGKAPPSGDLGPDGKPKKPATTSDLERGAERAKKLNEQSKPFDVAELTGMSTA